MAKRLHAGAAQGLRSGARAGRWRRGNAARSGPGVRGARAPPLLSPPRRSPPLPSLSSPPPLPLAPSPSQHLRTHPSCPLAPHSHVHRLSTSFSSPRRSARAYRSRLCSCRQRHPIAEPRWARAAPTLKCYPSGFPSGSGLCWTCILRTSPVPHVRRKRTGPLRALRTCVGRRAACPGREITDARRVHVPASGCRTGQIP